MGLIIVNSSFIVWLIPMVWLGVHPIALANEVLIALLISLALLVAARSKNLWLSANVSFAFGCIGGLAVQTVLGGIQSSGFIGIWFMLIPIFASALLNRRAAIFWLGVFIAITIFAVTFDAEIARLAPPVPPAFTFMNSIMNISIVSLIVVRINLYLIAQLDDARERADNLLLNILPHPIAEQLKRSRGIIADGYAEVTVLFADIAGFTQLSAHAEPKEVVNLLNAIFSDFDDLAAKHGLEKIKTIGDAYMVVGGLPTPRADHAEAVVEMAQAMLQVLKRHRAWNGEPIRVRVGINTGPVVAGVIGRQKFIYDLWGDAVNTASRMESNGLVDAIQVTESTYQKLRERYQFEQREPMHIKGKGQMVTYLLKGRINGAG
jgi:class 3 adenylate cyclase